MSDSEIYSLEKAIEAGIKTDMMVKVYFVHGVLLDHRDSGRGVLGPDETGYGIIGPIKDRIGFITLLPWREARIEIAESELLAARNHGLKDLTNLEVDLEEARNYDSDMDKEEFNIDNLYIKFNAVKRIVELIEKE